MAIQAHTTYTRENLLAFIRFNTVKSPVQIGVYILMETLVLAYTLMLANETGSSPVLYTVIMLLILPAVLLLFPFFLVNARRQVFGVTLQYTFTEDQLTLTSQNGQSNNQTNAQYSLFYRVYETPDAFYFFISSRQAFLLDKSGFTEGTAQDLRTLLQSKLAPEKYKIKK